MARRKVKSADWLFPTAAIHADPEEQSSLLDVVDSVLNKGAVVNGDVVLGVANVDLIYAKLSVVLAALDRVMGAPATKRNPQRHEGVRRNRKSRKKT